MKDVWTNTINSRRYTHHTRTSAAGLDRIYVTGALYDNKIAATIVAAAFTDHFAMILRIKLHVPRIRMGRGYWKLNITLLTVDVINETCKKHWEIWNKMRCRYTDTTWWLQYVKRRIRFLFTAEGRRHSEQWRMQEEFYFQCIYDLMAREEVPTTMSTKLHFFQRRIQHIQTERLTQTVTLLRAEAPRASERPSLVHLLKIKKRNKTHVITSLCTDDGHKITTLRDIHIQFRDYFQQNYDILESGRLAILSNTHGKRRSAQYKDL